MSEYEVTQQARDDLRWIYANGLRRFGLYQSDKYLSELFALFDRLALNPKMARAIFEEGEPDRFRVFPHKAHIVIYAVRSKDILILAIKPSRSNWMKWASGLLN